MLLLGVRTIVDGTRIPDGWATVRKARLQVKRLVDICRKSFSQTIHLSLDLWERPVRDALFKYSHMADKVAASFTIERIVWRCNGGLMRRLALKSIALS